MALSATSSPMNQSIETAPYVTPSSIAAPEGQGFEWPGSKELPPSTSFSSAQGWTSTDSAATSPTSPVPRLGLSPETTPSTTPRRPSYHWDPYSNVGLAMECHCPVNYSEWVIQGLTGVEGIDDDCACEECERIASAYGYQAISHLRVLPNADAIFAVLCELPLNASRFILSAVRNIPSLFVELCCNDRGNVLIEVLALQPPLDTTDVFTRFLTHFDLLAFNAGGSIALNRVYRIAPDWFREEMNTKTIQRIDSLISHCYGNFIVSQMLILSSEWDLRVTELSVFTPEGFQSVATIKFGSRALETWIDQTCDVELFFWIADRVISDPRISAFLCHHPIGNYTMKRLLQRVTHLRHLSPKLHEKAVRLIPPLTRYSDGRLHILRALGLYVKGPSGTNS